MSDTARIVIFCHSLASDWNHGNAHFLRGVARELVARGHGVTVFEPADGWSAANLVQDHGAEALHAWKTAYPTLSTTRYERDRLDLDRALDGADLVIVHEWNDPALVARIGNHRAHGGRYALLFHDTHHRLVSDPDSIRAFELDGYDGVLAFGEVLRDAYTMLGWARQAFAWHEAADLALFRPRPQTAPVRDLVWVGNWGDDERTAELDEFLIGPVRDLGLDARIHGVRYPDQARAVLAEAGIDFAGYLPNFRVPDAFAEARVTAHVPRRPYVEALPGIPTIRVFEALACGIPLISAPWNDVEGLFSPGADFLMAADCEAMRRHLRFLLNEPEAARALADHGRATVEARHSCAHRVDELFAICRALGRDMDPGHGTKTQERVEA